MIHIVRANEKWGRFRRWWMLVRLARVVSRLPAWTWFLTLDDGENP